MLETAGIAKSYLGGRTVGSGPLPALDAREVGIRDRLRYGGPSLYRHHLLFTASDGTASAFLPMSSACSRMLSPSSNVQRSTVRRIQSRRPSRHLSTAWADDPHEKDSEASFADSLTTRRPPSRRLLTERVWTFAVILLCGPAIGYVVARALLWLRSL
jgi:hypothetical protein